MDDKLRTKLKTLASLVNTKITKEAKHEKFDHDHPVYKEFLINLRSWNTSIGMHIDISMEHAGLTDQQYIDDLNSYMDRISTGMKHKPYKRPASPIALDNSGEALSSPDAPATEKVPTSSSKKKKEAAPEKAEKPSKEDTTKKPAASTKTVPSSNKEDSAKKTREPAASSNDSVASSTTTKRPREEEFTEESVAREMQSIQKEAIGALERVIKGLDGLEQRLWKADPLGDNGLHFHPYRAKRRYEETLKKLKSA